MFLKKKISTFNHKTSLLVAASIVVIIFSVGLIYSNAIHTPFQLDDQHMIEHSERVKDVNNYLILSKWIQPKLNRVFAELTFALNYQFSRLNVEGYHITNIVIHVINSILVYWLILTLFQFNVVQREKVSGYYEVIAFLGAMIFAVHPMQMQAVTYITQRLASLTTLFYLAGTLFYAKGRLSSVREKRRAVRFGFYLLTALSFYFGTRSKQNIATLPLALLAVEFFFVRSKDGKICKRYLLIYTIIILLSAVLYVTVIGILHPAEAPEPVIYLASQLDALTIYISKLFVPVSLKLYYNLPFPESFFSTKEILNIFILLFVIITAVFLFKRARLLSFGIIWFFITMLVESSIFPLKFSFFEYRVYPGMFGFALLISSLPFYLKNEKVRSIFLSVITIGILLFASATYQINKVWIDPIKLWKDNAAKTPEFSIPHENVGIYYQKKGELDSAFFYFSKAIELDSTIASFYVDRGIVFFQRGNIEAALNDFSKSIQLKEENPIAYNNRGFVYLRIHNFKKAVNDFKRAAELFKKYSQAYSNLCIAYNALGEYKKAFEAINKAIKLKSKRADYYVNRGNLHFSIGDFHVAAANYMKAIKLSETNYKAWNNLALTERILNNHEKAIEYSSKALQINPSFVSAYINRALAENILGHKKEALDDIEKALSISPFDARARFLRASLRGEKISEIKITPEFIYKKGAEK